jgi:Derlin-2/3
MRFALFGLVPIKAPYITWFFILLQIVFGHSILNDIIGVAIGHLYYFFEDVYPKLKNSNGVRILKTPDLFSSAVRKFGLRENNMLAGHYLEDDLMNFGI